MKKTNRILFLFLTTIVTVFSSCTVDVEPIDPTVLDENPIINPGENPANPSGDYWPMAINNQWTYKKNGTIDSPLKIIATEEFDGKTYYKYSKFLGTTLVDEANFSGDVWTRKENNTYYIRESAFFQGQNTSPSITVLPNDVIVLKDNLAVNQTWTQSYTQTLLFGTLTVPSEVTVVGKIMEKDIQVTVNGQVYNEVIKVELTRTTIISSVNYYWFAKNIGIIKFQDETNTYEIVSQSLN